MAALGWLLNLDFAAGTSAAPPAVEVDHETSVYIAYASSEVRSATVILEARAAAVQEDVREVLVPSQDKLTSWEP